MVRDNEGLFRRVETFLMKRPAMKVRVHPAPLPEQLFVPLARAAVPRLNIAPVLSKLQGPPQSSLVDPYRWLLASAFFQTDRKILNMLLAL